MPTRIANLWIIDDDPMASFIIKRVAELGELAAIITIYDEPRGAVDYLLQHKNSVEHLPDVILLDIYMPDLDAWGFLAEFSKIKNELKKTVEIYIISASSNLNDIHQAKSFPQIKAYIQKPVTKEKLRDIIESHGMNS